MADDPVREYLDSLREHGRSRAEAQQLVDVVRKYGSVLNRWETVKFSNINIGLPIDMETTAILDAQEWPAIEPLVQAIAKYHQVFRAMRNAWRRIPQADQAGLQPPPEQ